MTTTDTETGLLRAIIESPEDDTPRLILADWWEENGQPERAEFCRVQCELAGMENNPLKIPTFVDWFHRKEALRQRERQLWVAHCREWFNVGGIEAAKLRQDSSQNNYGNVLAIIERGFPAEIHAPLAVLVGGECERCGGTGDDETSPCLRCGGSTRPMNRGTGTRPGIAADLIRTQPVQVWRAADKRPWQWSRSGRFGWFVGDERVGILAVPDAARIPLALLQLMGDPDFPTEADALAALSAAVATIAKQQGAK